MSREFSHRIRVRYAECDPQGVVFNANYYAYYDLLMTEMWREAIGPYDEMVKSGTDMAVVESRARFVTPARFDDELDLNAHITRLGNTSMSTHITIARPSDGATITDGEIHHVFIDAQAYTKRPIPADIRAALEPYVVPEQAESAA